MLSARPMMVGAILFGTLAAAGVGYTLLAAWIVARFGWGRGPVGAAEPVSLLKPLHGAEPRLAENLATFLDQAWDAPIEMIAGVQREDDPARDALTKLRRSGAGRDDDREIVQIVDTTRHGANGKVANLLNIAPHASQDLIVLSDSDMAVPPDYLARLGGALNQPNVGAVTCIYRGRGDAGFWSRIAAGGISYHFVPQLMIGLKLGFARPGMGSTIALRRATLEAVGGFAPFADSLADDYELGEAVRAQGLKVVVPPMMLIHGCTERTFRDVWLHERRWAATILAINPGGQIGTIVTHPIPLALIATCFSPRTGLVLLGAAMLARLILKLQIDRAADAVTSSLWHIPFRDCLSFATYGVAFFVRSVDWRGATLKMTSRGRIAAGPQTGLSGRSE